jgi:hypothetical protein
LILPAGRCVQEVVPPLRRAAISFHLPSSCFSSCSDRSFPRRLSSSSSALAWARSSFIRAYRAWVSCGTRCMGTLQVTMDPSDCYATSTSTQARAAEHAACEQATGATRLLARGSPAATRGMQSDEIKPACCRRQHALVSCTHLHLLTHGVSGLPHSGRLRRGRSACNFPIIALQQRAVLPLVCSQPPVLLCQPCHPLHLSKRLVPHQQALQVLYVRLLHGAAVLSPVLVPAAHRASHATLHRVAACGRRARRRERCTARYERALLHAPAMRGEQVWRRPCSRSGEAAPPPHCGESERQPRPSRRAAPRRAASAAPAPARRPARTPARHRAPRPRPPRRAAPPRAAPQERARAAPSPAPTRCRRRRRHRRARPPPPAAAAGCGSVPVPSEHTRGCTLSSTADGACAVWRAAEQLRCWEGLSGSAVHTGQRRTTSSTWSGSCSATSCA